MNQNQNEPSENLFQRNCPNPKNNPNCAKIVTYKDKSSWKTASDKNSCCKSCGMQGINIGKKHTDEWKVWASEYFSGNKNPFFGKHHSDATKELLRETSKNYVPTEEQKDRHRIACAGEKNGFYGKKHTEKTIRHLTELANTPDRIEKTRQMGINTCKRYGPRVSFVPGFNNNACSLFDEINKTMNWNGIHALNGGEFSVCGYWLDYYEPTLNIVIEYNENHHKTRHKLLKDKQRQDKIVNELNCTFYNINEWENKSWKDVIMPC